MRDEWGMGSVYPRILGDETPEQQAPVPIPHTEGTIGMAGQGMRNDAAGKPSSVLPLPAPSSAYTRADVKTAMHIIALRRIDS